MCKIQSESDITFASDIARQTDKNTKRRNSSRMNRETDVSALMMLCNNIPYFKMLNMIFSHVQNYHLLWFERVR